MYRVPSRRTVLELSFAAAVVLMPAAARADAIGGTWCSPDGERVTINGEDVVTPGGAMIKGTYTRHTMVFRIPAGEEGAGKTLYMEQLHDNAVRVTTFAEVQTEPGPHEEWSRCRPAVS